MDKIEFEQELIVGKKKLSKEVKENIIKSAGQIKEINVHICTDEDILNLIMEIKDEY